MKLTTGVKKPRRRRTHVSFGIRNKLSRCHKTWLCKLIIIYLNTRRSVIAALDLYVSFLASFIMGIGDLYYYFVDYLSIFNYA